MKFTQYSSLLIMILYLCISQPGNRLFGQENQHVSVHCNTGNIFSIEAENYTELGDWKPVTYYTGKGLTINSDKNSGVGGVSYSLTCDKPGDYYVHILGNRKRNTSVSDNIIQLVLRTYDDRVISSTRTGFIELNAPAWSSGIPDMQRPVLRFPSEGEYILELSPVTGKGFYMDKIVFSMDPDYLPEGVGPVETCISDCFEGDRNKIILPPQWAFGVLYGGYTDQDQTLKIIDTLIHGDFPIDAYWIDSYFWDFNEGKGPDGYLDFVGDTAAFPDMKKLWDEFEKRHIKAGIWIWNLVQQKGNEKVFEEFLERGYFSGTYMNYNGWHNDSKNTLTGSIDFENPEAVVFWKKKMKPFFDRGLDFLKLDNSSDIPFCSAAFSATQEMGLETWGRGFILAHLHTTYDYRHKLYPAKWTGDAKITWSQPDYPDLGVYAMGGLKENIAMVADPKRSTYEIPFLSHDAGGYNYFGSNDHSEELYTRWIQFSSMNSIMMFFSTNDNPTRNHPYRYSEPVQENFRKYTHLRMRLFPYIYSYAFRSHLTGMKMIQGDRTNEFQYMLGEEILVAPVFEEGARSKEIFLPSGEWIDPETRMIYKGENKIMIDAPLSKLPILYKKGAILPMRRYQRAIELGNNDSLILEIYPSESESSFTLYEDDGSSNEYLRGNYSTTVYKAQKDDKTIQFYINPVSGKYPGMKNERHYTLKFNLSETPRQIRLNRRKKGFTWSYLDEEKIILINLNVNKSDLNEICIKYR